MGKTEASLMQAKPLQILSSPKNEWTELVFGSPSLDR